MKNLVIILFLILFAFNLKAQRIEYVETKTENYGNYISEVQFIDTITGNVIKSINLINENPFFNIFKQNPKKDLQQHKTMHISINKELQLDDIMPKEKRNHYLRDADSLLITNVKILPKGYVYNYNDICIVSYRSFINTNEYYRYCMSVIIAYNSTGNVVFNKIFNSVGEAVISSNNKYLNIAFSMDNEDGNLYYPYYEIYNISNQSLIHKDIISKIGEGGVINYNDTIIFMGNEGNVIFDEDKMEIFKYKNINGKIIKGEIIKKL